MKLSIVIPAYNEEKRLGDSLLNIIRYLNSQKIMHEIIVVDDGSTDKTTEIIERTKGNIRVIHNPVNSGKGYSVRRGIEAARYLMILFSDSDLATPIEELLPMMKKLEEGYDVVIASRNLPGSNIIVHQPYYRQLMGKTFPLLVRLLLLPGTTDTQCGFKLFRKEAAKAICKYQTINRFCFDVEMLFIARRLGYRMVEVPVRWIDKKGSKVSPIKDSFKMLMDLLKIRHNDLRGKYDSR